MQRRLNTVPTSNLLFLSLSFSPSLYLSISLILSRYPRHTHCWISYRRLDIYPTAIGTTHRLARETDTDFPIIREIPRRNVRTSNRLKGRSCLRLNENLISSASAAAAAERAWRIKKRHGDPSARPSVRLAGQDTAAVTTRCFVPKRNFNYNSCGCCRRN